MLFGSIEDPYDSAQPSKKKLKIKGQKREKNEKSEKSSRPKLAKSRLFACEPAYEEAKHDDMLALSKQALRGASEKSSAFFDVGESSGDELIRKWEDDLLSRSARAAESKKVFNGCFLGEK